MMKLLFVIWFFLNFSAKTEIAEIRKIYPEAAASQNNAQDFASLLENVNHNDNNVLIAYKGAALTLRSKFSKKIPEKLTYFKEGAKLVELAISSEPQNVELRMIRLSIQESVPAIVNYKNNKKEDVAFIVNNCNDLKGNLKDYIKNFILKSPSFSKLQKLAIK